MKATRGGLLSGGGAIVALLALSAVSWAAFPGGAAADPPVVPTCTPKPSTGNDSCVRLAVNALAPPIGSAYENVLLGFRMRTVFQAPATPGNCASGGCWETNWLRFDSDIEVNFAGVPRCPKRELVGKTISQAWVLCGPGGGNNAYLSTGLGANVSGLASTVPPGNFDGCMLVFRAPDWNPPSGLLPSVWLYMRLFTSGGFTCANPGGNSGGTTTIVQRGLLYPQNGPYKWRLSVSNLHTTPLIMDDFYATLVRGAAFRARCPAGTSPHKLQGVFDYTGTDPTDSISPPYPGTTDPCA